MRIALLCGTPSNFDKGPDVRLVSGTWRLNVHGLADSKLSLHIDDVEHMPIFHGDEFMINYHATVSIGFNLKGKESHITVIAEKI